MKTRHASIFVILILITGQSVQASAADTFIEINDPEGVHGTRAWSLDAQDDVIGSYEDANRVRHGFIWHDGQFTTIDEPNAGHGPPLHGLPQGTTLYDINGFGDITGRYINSNYESRSFVLRAGMFTPIDDPASPRGPFHGTQADGINDAGDIVGDFSDEGFTVHGFVLHDGTYTTIDAPHAEHGRFERDARLRHQRQWRHRALREGWPRRFLRRLPVARRTI